jgi:hypothetical protein
MSGETENHDGQTSNAVTMLAFSLLLLYRQYAQCSLDLVDDRAETDRHYPATISDQGDPMGPQ